MSNRLDLGDGVAVIGAGLAGSLLAVGLRQLNYDVDVFERAGDMRSDEYAGGRSINLILTSRGIDSLNRLGLVDTVTDIVMPVIGRTMWAMDGTKTFQRYGPDDTYCNYSVSRSELNKVLMTAAEKHGARMHFKQPCGHLDIQQRTMYSYGPSATGQPTQRSVRARHFFATDGGGSMARQALKGLLGDAMTDNGVPLGCSYKELLMPAAADGSYPIDVHSLHIWPRGTHFLMALPNQGGSFTMTLYMSDTGPISFAEMNTREKVKEYFEKYYASALTLMPNLLDEYFSNPNGFLGTVYAAPWQYEDALVLVGDSSHAIVPFFGQGCNAAFESVASVLELLAKHTTPEATAAAAKTNAIAAVPGVRSVHAGVAAAFQEFFTTRKPCSDAIAAMAIENFVEMMKKTGEPKFLLQKEVELALAKAHPEYESRYAMVTHTLIPYDVCFATGKIQQEILEEVCADISAAADADMTLAAKLVKDKLIPFLTSKGVTPSSYDDPSYTLMNQGTEKK